MSNSSSPLKQKTNAGLEQREPNVEKRTETEVTDSTPQFLGTNLVQYCNTTKSDKESAQVLSYCEAGGCTNSSTSVKVPGSVKDKIVAFNNSSNESNNKKNAFVTAPENGASSDLKFSDTLVKRSQQQGSHSESTSSPKEEKGDNKLSDSSTYGLPNVAATNHERLEELSEIAVTATKKSVESTPSINTSTMSDTRDPNYKTSLRDGEFLYSEASVTDTDSGDRRKSASNDSENDKSFTGMLTPYPLQPEEWDITSPTMEFSVLGESSLFESCVANSPSCQGRFEETNTDGFSQLPFADDDVQIECEKHGSDLNEDKSDSGIAKEKLQNSDGIIEEINSSLEKDGAVTSSEPALEFKRKPISYNTHSSMSKMKISSLNFPNQKEETGIDKDCYTRSNSLDYKASKIQTSGLREKQPEKNVEKACPEFLRLDNNAAEKDEGGISDSEKQYGIKRGIEPLVSDSQNQDTHSRNLKHKPLFTQGKLPFWRQSNDGNFVYKADTPTAIIVSDESEENKENDAAVIECDTSTTSESELQENACSLTEDTDLNNPNTADSDARRPKNVHDQMLTIIKELRRLSGEDDSVIESDDSMDYWNSNMNQIVLPCPMATLDFGLKRQTPGLLSDTNIDLSPITEDNEISKTDTPENGNEKGTTNEGGVSSKEPLPLNVFVQWRDTTLSDMPGLSTNTKDNNKETFKSSSAKDKLPFNIFGGISSNHKREMDTEVVPNVSANKETISKERMETKQGIVKSSSKDNSSNSPLPKRVSFSIDGGMCKPSHRPPVLKANGGRIPEESAVDKKIDFQNKSLEKKIKLRNVSKQNTTDSAKQDKKEERAQKTLSLPIKLEGPDPGTERTPNGVIVLDFSTFGKSTDQVNRSNSNGNHSNGKGSDPDKDKTQDGSTNMAFILESPLSPYDNVEKGTLKEASAKQSEREYKLPKEIEEKLQRLKMYERGELPVRQASAEPVLKGKGFKFSNILKRWHSQDDEATESTSLKEAMLQAKAKENNRKATAQKTRFDFSEIREGSDDDILMTGTENASFDDRANKEEDTLSLEFFVPGKKKYIRLHRRTFIHFVLKYSIFFFTFLFWVASTSAVGFGAWMLTTNGVVIDDVTDVFLDPYVLLCVVGTIIFLVAFLGCVGALRDNIYLLKLFHVSLTAVLVIECLLSALVFLFYTMPEFRRAVKVGPEEVLKKAVKQYFDDESMKTWIDNVQKEFKCCGVSMSDDGYLDWEENPYFNCSTANPSVYRCSVPLSCCIFEPGDYINYMCGAGMIQKEESYVKHIIHTKGCMKSFGEWLAKNDAMVGCVGLGIIIPQILGVVAARYFIKHLDQRRTSWRQLSDPVRIETPKTPV